MNLNTNFSKIYYINLDRDEHRNRFILKEFKAKTCLADKIERFSAIDGRTINLSQIDGSIITHGARYDILSKKQKTFGITLTYGSLGCALSHKKLYENCILENNKPYLIFEDDAILINNFDQKLNELLLQLSQIDYDIVYLGYHQIPHAKSTQINDVLSKPHGLICGTYGYIVSPNGARKILDIFPLKQQIDSSISANLNKWSSYCHTEQLVKTNRSFISNTQKNYSCKNIY